MHFKLLRTIVCMDQFLYKVNLAFEIVCCLMFCIEHFKCTEYYVKF